jgi:hypothetical protein
MEMGEGDARRDGPQHEVAGEAVVEAAARGCDRIADAAAEPLLHQFQRRQEGLELDALAKPSAHARERAPGQAMGRVIGVKGGHGRVVEIHRRDYRFVRQLTALIANSSILGLLIPPPVTMIVYGWVTETSILACFPSTLGPGLLIMTLFCVVNIVVSRKFPLVMDEAPKASEFAALVAKKGFHANQRSRRLIRRTIQRSNVCMSARA